MIIEAVLAAALYATSSDTRLPDLTAPRTAAVMTGPRLPYRGRFRIASQDAFALCVLRRESNYHWFSTNRAGGYFGGFQFSAGLARGATWMMTPELKAVFGADAGRGIARELRATEMHRWLPYWQHMAFATVLNWEYPGSGARHWAGGRFHCGLGGGR